MGEIAEVPNVYGEGKAFVGVFHKWERDIQEEKI